MISERTCVALLLSVGSIACSTHREGIELDLGAQPHAGEKEPGEARIAYPAGTKDGTITDLGYRVLLRQAYVTVARLEIVPCEEMTAGRIRPLESRQALGWKHVLRWLSPVSIAHAHGSATPMRMAAPHVLDLLAADASRLSLPRLRPPPGRYCAVDVLFDAPDADAAGLPSMPDMAAGGLTAYFAGEVVRDEDRWDFVVEVTEDRSVRLPFVDEAGAPHAMRLDSHQRQARLTLRFGYGSACSHASKLDASRQEGCAGLLDGIDFGTADDGGRQFQAMDNLISNVQAHACAGPGCDVSR